MLSPQHAARGGSHSDEPEHQTPTGHRRRQLAERTPEHTLGAAFKAAVVSAAALTVALGFGANALAQTPLAPPASKAAGNSNAKAETKPIPNRQRGSKLTPSDVDAMTSAAVDAYAEGDKAQAARGFRVASDAGHPVAQFNLAMMQVRKETAERNKGEALQWLTRAAQQEFAPAQYALALLYDYGDRVERSPAKANEWFERAARQGHTDAQLALANNYYLGRGTRQDSPKALFWFEKAAEGGDLAAQSILASMYETGDGTPIDLERAREWYVQAARAGEPGAAEKARAITDKLRQQRQQPESPEAGDGTAGTRL